MLKEPAADVQRTGSTFVEAKRTSMSVVDLRVRAPRCDELCRIEDFEGWERLLKPIRDKPQGASNGDERPNRENAAQPAVLQAIQTQPQPSQHNERGYEYTCNTLRFLIHFLTVAGEPVATI